MSSITNNTPRAAIGVSRWRQPAWWMAGILGGLLLLGAIWFALALRAMASENTPPPDLDVSRARLSAQGLYRASYTPNIEPIATDRLHAWSLHLESAGGQPVDGAAITVRGDMPGHGHGLPTQPIVSQRANGDYLVEGMKFQMAGWWYVTFDISAGDKHDTVRFDFVLK